MGHLAVALAELNDTRAARKVFQAAITLHEAAGGSYQAVRTRLAVAATLKGADLAIARAYAEAVAPDALSFSAGADLACPNSACSIIGKRPRRGMTTARLIPTGCHGR